MLIKSIRKNFLSKFIIYYISMIIRESNFTNKKISLLITNLLRFN